MIASANPTTIPAPETDDDVAGVEVELSSSTSAAGEPVQVTVTVPKDLAEESVVLVSPADDDVYNVTTAPAAVNAAPILGESEDFDYHGRVAQGAARPAGRGRQATRDHASTVIHRNGWVRPSAPWPTPRAGRVVPPDWIDLRDVGRREVAPVIYQLLADLIGAGWRLRRQGHKFYLYCPCGDPQGRIRVDGTPQTRFDKLVASGARQRIARTTTAWTADDGRSVFPFDNRPLVPEA